MCAGLSPIIVLLSESELAEYKADQSAGVISVHDSEVGRRYVVANY
jgi:hypothetical protein